MAELGNWRDLGQGRFAIPANVGGLLDFDCRRAEDEEHQQV